MDLTPEQAAFKAAYIRDRGYWVPFNDGLLALSPGYLEAHFAYASQPGRTGPLPLKTRELIYVAVDTSTTHMFGEGLGIHIRAALRAGCSPVELIETMQLAAQQGVDSVSGGIGIVVEELAAAGLGGGTDARPLSDAEAKLRADYIARFDDWPLWCDQLVRRDPDYFAVLTAMLDAPALTGGLDAKTRAIVRFALAAAPTHLDRPAMREHCRRAIAAGVTGAELIEVLQLVAHLGIHACVIGVPMLVEALGEQGARAKAA